MKKFIVTTPMSLRDFTDATYPQGSFALSALLRQKDVKVNGVKVGQNVPLQTGDEVAYYTTPKQEQKPSHTVLYEDDQVLVVDKFSGVSVEALAVETGYILVHRLDRNTSGVMVLAKTDAVEVILKESFKLHDMQKIYLCLCKNNFKKMHDYMTAYLVKDDRQSLVKVYAEGVSGSQKIITEYTVLKKLGDYALVQVALHTGKTHQIRAHMAFIGCPVLGDEKYGDEALNKKYAVKRQCLVAKSLTVQAPNLLADGMTFTSSFFPEVIKN